MISYIEGELLHKGDGFVIIKTGGIGYQVFLPDQAMIALRDPVSLFTHEVIRETEHELFGFISASQLEFFLKVIGVSGVGPKSGQRIVFADEIESVRKKISHGDLGFLTSISGIGKKTAQKIILELKGELVDDEGASGYDEDALAALQALGYPRRDAEQILSTVQGETTEERIRAALKILGK